MIRLSVVIITFNEEKKIGQCIDSLLPVADEIVVVDSFSTDRTEAICKEKEVRFLQHKFTGHIEQKNYAFEQSTFDHVLSLDADEALSDKLAQEIKNVKSNWKYDGYYMNRLTNYCGKWVRHCGWYPDRKLRLVNKTKGKWGGVNPHDRYVMHGAGAKTAHLSGDILHYSYDSIEDHYKQVDYFTDIASKAMYEKGVRAGFIYPIFAPAIKFIRDYFLKFGFLDGSTGWTICRISAYATRLKYQKLKMLERSSGLQSS